MKHWPFPIALGILTLLKLSQFSLAAGGEESKLREPFNKAVKTEKRQRQQPLIKVALVSIPDSKYSERFPLISLDRSLFQRIAQFLPPEDVLQLAQVSQNGLGLVASQLPLELSLESKELTEEDFLRYFGENGFYKEAQCLNLSNSSFNPAWLKHLPKTLKALKLISINTKRFSEYGYASKSAMIIELVDALGKLPRLKFLDISDNNIEDTELEHIVKLRSLTSLIMRWNRIKDTGAKYIAQLRSLTSLDIS